MQWMGALVAQTRPSISAFPETTIGSACTSSFFEDCSAFTHVAACTLARSPKSRPLSEGFRHFVTSMPAPVASGWSGCRVGLAPTGKRRLVTAHVVSGPPLSPWRTERSRRLRTLPSAPGEPGGSTHCDTPTGTASRLTETYSRPPRLTVDLDHQIRKATTLLRELTQA